MPKAERSARPLIAIDGVSHRYGEASVLDAVSLDIREGEFLTLLGPSGCGKTTLLRLIAGFEPVQSGHIAMGGEDLARLASARRPVNTVFQSYALFPHLTVAGNVGFGLRMLGRGRAEIDARVTEMLALVRLADFGGRRIGELSGGQQQRVALARALAPQPKLLLLDEPLGALDQMLRQEMQAELKHIQKSLGMTFLFVTHDREEALSMSDRIAVMQGGRIVECDSPQALYAHPSSRFVATFLGDANVLPGRVRVIEPGRAGVEIGGDLVSVAIERPLTTSGPVGVMVRPEHVRLGAHDGIRRTALLERHAFLGTDHCLDLHLDTGEPIRLRTRDDTAAGLEPGQMVTITIPHRHLRLLEDA